ncbi:MAG: polysaccharide deacetylase family protein [Candidatus Omnitrophica bacterium]|nr:polysaccharide deacetylase family protein [Candidatus Omnitrophota bacterium]
MRTIKPGNKRFSILVIAATVIFLLAGKLFLDAAYAPVIIMYHSVGPESTTPANYGDKLNVSTRTFEKQMKFLADHDYNVIPLAEFVNRIKRNERIPHKTLTITFDDGLKNNFTNAYPILKKYKFPATIFVATDFIGRNNFLIPEDMKIMQKNNITIGSHTISHPFLPWMTDENIRKELFGSKKILEEITGQRIDLFSYPFGRFSDKTEEIVKDAGYMGAVTTSPGRTKPNDNIYALKRIRISMSSDNPVIFWIETSGYYTFVKEIRDED